MAIIEEVVAGIPSGVQPIVEPDRRRAIALAVADRRPGDVVVVAGKGHESGQTAGGVTVPFDDRDVAREELARVGYTGAMGEAPG
jgi:UDP-N-acetylmuramoyl-L-alanyl-D-glutamate--2,6-diaminopimelate ligase